jgi:hypothetical protein
LPGPGVFDNIIELLISLEIMPPILEKLEDFSPY